MQLQSNKLGKEETDHIYFNLTYVNNNGPGTNAQYVPAKVIQQYDRAIINNPEEWNVSIVRFSISSDAIGVIYQPYPTTSLNTNFYVSLSYNGTYYDEPIVLPTDEYDGTMVQTVYNINDLLDLINTGYGLAASLVTSAGGPTGATGAQVLMTYEPTTELYTMNIPGFYGTGTVGTAGNGIGVHMSYQLYKRFGSFSITQNSPLLWNNHDVTFNRVWRGNNLTDNINYPVSNTGVGTTGPYMQLFQSAPWASSIQSIDRLIITSTSIPVILEYRANQNYLQGIGNNANQTLNILTDFFIGDDSNLISHNENWIYTPQIYRIASLQGNQPMRQLDIQVFVSSTDGSIYPLFLSPAGGNIDVKILFLKKGLTA
jgi:hypothetical protein